MHLSALPALLCSVLSVTRSIFYFQGDPKLASLVEMIKHIILDMLPFTIFVALLIFAFGLCMFVLHSTHPKDVEGSFGTLQEALFTTVSQSVCMLTCLICS